MRHSITENHGGNGWTIWTDAVCTCGWHGKRLWGFDNPAWYDFKREQAEHLSAATPSPQAGTAEQQEQTK